MPVFILYGLIFYDCCIRKGVEGIDTLVKIFIFLGLFQLSIIYYIMGLPEFGSYYGGWIYNAKKIVGQELGITKGGLSFFGTVSLLWFIIKKKYFFALLFFTIFSPVLIESRTILVTFIIILTIHFFIISKIKIGKINKGLISFFLGWTTMLTGILYSIFVLENFDRLPSYIIGYDVINETGNLFGLGFRNYQYYIIENIDRLNENYSYLMPSIMTSFYTSAESMYSDSFASYGILGITILIIYNLVLFKSFKQYFKLTNNEKWFVMIWALFVWGGVAQDFTSANGFFYLVLGINIALLKKYNQIITSK